MFTIDELTEETGISVRTIHYYIKKGLLPNPKSRGPSTRYGQEYIDRLKLIQVLKANHHPLDEIATLLGKITETDISRFAILGEQNFLRYLQISNSEEPVAQAKEEMKAEEAREYIRQVLNLSNTTTGKLRQPSQKIPPQPLNPTASSWARIELTDGVELHVDNNKIVSIKEKIDQLVRYAAKLLK